MSSRSKAPSTAWTGPAWWIAGSYLAAALIAQTEVLHFFPLRNAEISIVLAVVVWYAIHADISRAAVFGLVAGLCEDVLATQTGAAFTISTTLTAILAGTLSSGFFADSIALVSAIVFGATLVRDAIFWIVLSVQGYPGGYAREHFHQSLWQALFTAGFVAAVMLVLRWKEHLSQR